MKAEGIVIPDTTERIVAARAWRSRPGPTHGSRELYGLGVSAPWPTPSQPTLSSCAMTTCRIRRGTTPSPEPPCAQVEAVISVILRVQTRSPVCLVSALASTSFFPSTTPGSGSLPAHQGLGHTSLVRLAPQPTTSKAATTRGDQ